VEANDVEVLVEGEGVNIIQYKQPLNSLNPHSQCKNKMMNWYCRKGIVVLLYIIFHAFTTLPAIRGFVFLPVVPHHLPKTIKVSQGQLKHGISTYIHFPLIQKVKIYHFATSINQPEDHDNEYDDDDEDPDDPNVAAVTQQPTTSISRRRRRRRKENDNNEVDNTVATLSTATTTTTSPSLQVVSIPIVDVRNLVSDTTTITTITSDTTTSVSDPRTMQQEQSNVTLQSKLGSDSSSIVDRSNSRISSSSSSNSSTETTAVTTTIYDPLEQLLLDVKEMRSMSNSPKQQQLENGNNNNNDRNNEGTILPTETTMSISKVLSTIVIVDFFVVLIFFVWFLLGIVSSYTIKDDTIQIAFNSNFQTLVQPALGILMIASISDAIFKDEK
jgi:hypothetical protein